MKKASGTTLPDGTVVLRGAVQQKRIRCMGCQREAVPFIRPDGKKVLRCHSCGREWVETAF